MTEKLFKKGRLTRDVLEQQDTTTDKVLTAVLVAPATVVLDAPETMLSAAEDVFDAVGSWFDPF